MPSNRTKESIATSERERAPDVGCAVCGEDRWAFVREAKDLSSPEQVKFTLAQCLSCGHIAQNPAPDESALRTAYSREYAPYRFAWKEAGRPLWKILRDLTTWRRMSRLQRYGTGGRLLEIGCGAGDFLYAAQRAGWNTSAVEYSQRMAEVLHRELGLDVRAGELTPGLWEPGQFDVVALWSVLEHLPNPSEALATAAKYLKPGGTMFIQVPTRGGVGLGRWFGESWVVLDLPRHLNFFGRDSLARICDKAGLKLSVFKTPLLDTLWCYLASSVTYSNSGGGRLQRRLRFAALAVLILIASPWLAMKAWRGLGTEAFAVAIKR